MARNIVARKYGGKKNSTGYPVPTGFADQKSTLFLRLRRKTKKGPNVQQLCMAIAHGEVDEALKIIQSGDCDINAPDASGNCPLHTALHYDQLAIVEALLQNTSCEVNKLEEVTNLYPIHIAAHKTSPECLDLLLAAQSQDGEMWRINLDIPDQMSQNTALSLAAREGHLAIVERLVTAGCTVNIANASGDCPLYMAMLKGHASVARHLLENGASFDVVSHGSKGTELFFYCMYSHEDSQVLRILLEHGERPNVLSPEGRTPLMYAIKWEQHNMLKVLLDEQFRKQLNVNVLTPDTHESALFQAVRTTCTSRKPTLYVVQVLLQRGAHVNITNNQGMQPLDIAIMHNATDLVEVLLDAGAIIRSRTNKTVLPPLIFCAQRGATAIASQLIFYGAPLDAGAYDGDSPLYTALKHRHRAMVELLIQSGCNLSAEQWLTNNSPMPELLEEGRKLLSHLRELSKSPSLLSHLCRKAVRQYLCTNSIPLLSILDLKQPSAIKNFLLCIAPKGANESQV